MRTKLIVHEVQGNSSLVVGQLLCYPRPSRLDGAPCQRRRKVASIVVRRLPDVTKERLRQRAARHRRSLEAEVRAT
jgi:hypothetical protein